jgi:hypothetical protein
MNRHGVQEFAAFKVYTPKQIRDGVLRLPKGTWCWALIKEKPGDVRLAEVTNYGALRGRKKWRWERTSEWVKIEGMSGVGRGSFDSGRKFRIPTLYGYNYGYCGLDVIDKKNFTKLKRHHRYKKGETWESWVASFFRHVTFASQYKYEVK